MMVPRAFAYCPRLSHSLCPFDLLSAVEKCSAKGNRAKIVGLGNRQKVDLKLSKMMLDLGSCPSYMLW